MKCVWLRPSYGNEGGRAGGTNSQTFGVYLLFWTERYIPPVGIAGTHKTDCKRRDWISKKPLTGGRIFDFGDSARKLMIPARHAYDPPRTLFVRGKQKREKYLRHMTEAWTADTEPLYYDQLPRDPITDTQINMFWFRLTESWQYLILC